VATARSCRWSSATEHQLALTIWLTVFPTLAVLNLVLGDWLTPMSTVLRTFVLATVAVPIVIYGLMPQLHRMQTRLGSRRQLTRRRTP
jgi:antibiotic biosynthesis monooxygenase (ABM) superfamily enzyme